MKRISTYFNYLRFPLGVLSILLVFLICKRPYSVLIELVLSVGGILILFPMIIVARILIDKKPTVDFSNKITTIVHWIFLCCGVAAITKSVQLAKIWPLWLIPIPVPIGAFLFVAFSFISLFTIINLAQGGFGAPNPFLGSYSIAVAKNEMYAWTRNPMVLSFLLSLISVGLWLRALSFVLWVLVFMVPFFVFFLKIYEERELEIRFGQEYLEYKNKTPMFWPRKPKL